MTTLLTKMSSILSMVKKANLDKNQNPKSKFLPKCTKIVKSDKTVYGINTGLVLCDVKISEEETAQLQENLIISFCRSRKTNC